MGVISKYIKYIFHQGTAAFFIVQDLLRRLGSCQQISGKKTLNASTANFLESSTNLSSFNRPATLAGTQLGLFFWGYVFVHPSWVTPIRFLGKKNGKNKPKNRAMELQDLHLIGQGLLVFVTLCLAVPRLGRGSLFGCCLRACPLSRCDAVKDQRVRRAFQVWFFFGGNLRGVQTGTSTSLLPEAK